MGKSLYNTVNFVSGEWSPRLDARVDQPKYASAQRKCQNFIPYETGGLTRRPGTKYIAACKFQDTDVWQYVARLIPFQFSPTTSFMLEFGHQYIRFYSNQQQVLVAGVPLEVATPYNGRVSYGPSIYTCDVWTLTPCQINDVVYLVHPSYPPYKLTRLSDTNWTMVQVQFITPALLDQNATDTTIASSATTGNVTLTATAPAWGTTNYYAPGNSVLQAGVIYNCLIAHRANVFATDLAAGDWIAVSIFVSSQIGSTWQLAYLNAATVLEVDGTAAAGFTNGTSATLDAFGDCQFYTKGVWSSDIALQQSLDGGTTWTTIRTITSRSDANFDEPVSIAVQSKVRFVITNSVALVGGGATNPRVMFQVLDGFRYGLVQITAVASAYSASATVVTPLLNTSATIYWSEAAWSGYRGYPRAITAFQQRMIYGATAYEPQRIWGTVTNDLENFGLGDQTKATDAIVFDLAAVGRGSIQWLVGQVDLFAGFSGAEWIVNAGQGSFGGSNQPITPTQINAGEHSSWGSAPGIPSAIIGNAVVYVQRAASSLQQMKFSVYTNKYQSNQLTTLSEHMFTDGIVQIAYQPLFRNQGIIWVTTQSGGLCGMTYQPEGETYGWHRHITGYNPTLNSNDYFESVAVIDGQNSQDDEVWTVVDRGSRYIELVNPANWEIAGQPVNGLPTPDITQAVYVDCATIYSFPGSLTLTGLSRLNGRAVYGLADGIGFGPLTVSGGAITLPSSFQTTVATVAVGLPIYYIGQTMRIDQGAQGITQSLYKTISDVFVRVYNSMGGAISNGTQPAPTWVSGRSYFPNTVVISPATQLSYVCQITTASAVDPSEDPANWQEIPLAATQLPVPIPYANNPAIPFPAPQLVTDPQDIRITPQQMPSTGSDPLFEVVGNDALPLTVLALVLHYDTTGTP